MISVFYLLKNTENDSCFLECISFPRLMVKFQFYDYAYESFSIKKKA
jgi:hypothetical protein